MTDKELRKLRRDDLLQILIDQQKQIETLNRQLEEANRALEDRTIAIEESGSIAEAALKLNHVFSDAQSAADQYLAHIRAGAEDARSQAEREAQQLLDQARASADKILSDARMERNRILSDAQKLQVQPTVAETTESSQSEEAPRKRMSIFGKGREA
ncbi:MAG: hypothetical protein IJ074_04755 [Clostridia bacterium]|nr:hypothetical protein [Clostridia bacterium]